MQLFTDYIQPFSLWLEVHPHLALFITFFISFTESLAIIGSIIPGSLTMTAIGILAGSGIMRIDLTFLAAALGAIAGDTGSYSLGYTFSDRLIYVWPFKRYPALLSYGKEFFARHGATSVLIGRFVGPARSIIPLIAGMMHMNRWHFLVANIISAIGWSILYVLPGVLIGIASSELSTQNATHLFGILLILLVILWVASLGLKWLIVYLHRSLHTKLHRVWMSLKQNKRLSYYINGLAPKQETNHSPTAALIISFLFCFIMSIAMGLLTVPHSWIIHPNEAIYSFMQSIRTPYFDTFLISFLFVIHPFTLLTLVSTYLMYTIYYHDWRTLRYWLSLSTSTCLILFIMKPSRQWSPYPPLNPSLGLTLGTSLFMFLAFYINAYFRLIPLILLHGLLMFLLSGAGFALLYLGDKSLGSILLSFFIGLTLALLHWIFYRRQLPDQKRPSFPLLLSYVLLALVMVISYRLFFKQMVASHATHTQQFVMTDDVWWNQQQPLLPLYSTSRIGRRAGFLNIQYAGSIDKLVKALQEAGWKTQSNSFFYSLLLRASGGHQSTNEVPLMAQIYLHNKPVLIMTYKKDNKEPLLILRLWRSNYHLKHYQEPLWIGSVMPRWRYKHHNYEVVAVHKYILKSLPNFTFKKIIVPEQYLKPLPYPVLPILLIIKELPKNE